MRPLAVRIWRTGLDESRAPEYEDFARTVSLPMFRRHDGSVVCCSPGPAVSEW